MASRSDATVTSRDVLAVDRPLCPSRGSKKRKVRLTSVLLPEPDGPTSATVRPEGTVRLTPFSTRVVRLIGEGHIVEFDLAALQRERLGVGSFDQTASRGR